MVNNYPEYAAGVSYQKAEENAKHFYNAQVKVDPSDDSLSALLTKDGVVIAELPDGGGGGSSDFSTANVTIIGGDDGLTLSGGIDGESEGYIFLNSTEYGDIGVTTIVVPAGTTITAKAVLFKNLEESFPHDFYAVFGAADGFNIASIEGDCVLSPSGDVAIWGDCTIAGGEPQ